MPDIDDRLQQYISQIEAGVPKDQVLSSLNEGEQELVALIKLADAMRSITHPLPAPAYSRAAKQKIMATVPRTLPKRASNGKFQLGWLLFPSLTGAVALLVVMFITFGTLGIWLAGPASADVALTTDIEGVVELAASADSTEWAIMTGGESLRSGQYIRTSPGSSVALQYSDGSRTRIGPETSLLLKKIDGSWSGDIQVVLEQSVGQTTHDVVPLHSQKAYYTVITPSGEANVHGTTFEVNVEASGVSRVIVEDGSVMVTGASDEMIVPAGQATLLRPGAAQEVGNFFSVVDIVESIQGNKWSISGQSLLVSNSTHVEGAPNVGDVLQIEGRILANGQWVADSIAPLQEVFGSYFTGMVEGIASNLWSIGGKAVIVNQSTYVEQDVSVGDTVEVEYYALASGNWLALGIKGLEEESTTQTEESETTSELPAVNTGETENRVVTCQQDQTQTEAQRLSEQFAVTYEEIMVWYCSGYEFSEIELAYSMSELFGQPVYVLFDLNRTMTWSEINTYLSQYQLLIQPGTGDCLSDAQFPKAEQLANKYGVAIGEVANLFCQGYSFSTIDLTLSLSQAHGVSVEEILSKKAKGLNWGQIKKELRDKDTGKPEGKPEKEDNPNKPEKEDNPNKPENPSEGFEPPGQSEKDELTE